MDVQNACLSKIVRDGELLPFIEAKITPEFFTDESHAQVWSMVIEHYQAYGKPPEVAVIHRAYPNYDFPEFPEPTGYYLNQLRQDRKKVILTHTFQDFAERLRVDEGPAIGDELEVILRGGMAQATHEISQGRDTDFFLSHERLRQRLAERRENPGYLRGITTGFNRLDFLTGGLQAEQLITLVGTPKAGKSSVLLRTAYNAHRNGNHVLFATFEMGTTEQEDRLLSLVSGVGLSDILNGTYTLPQERAIQTALTLRKDMHGFTITSDVSGAINLSGITAKIQQYDPALVIIDGVYLMEDETGHDQGSPQALTALTRGLKRLGQTRRLPILISTQAMLYRSKRGLKMDSVGYSSSFVQDSDVIFGVEADETHSEVSHLKVLGSRSGPRGEAIMRFDWSQGLVEEIELVVWEKMQQSSAGGGSGQSSPAPRSGLQQRWQGVSNGP